MNRDSSGMEEVYVLDNTLYAYFHAPSEPDSWLGCVWADKPHRLLYDLCWKVLELHKETRKLRGELDKLKASRGKAKEKRGIVK